MFGKFFNNPDDPRFMDGRLFKGGGKGGGSAPAPSPAPRALPAPPERSDEKTASLAESQRSKFSSSKSKGRASTFLSGGSTTQGSSAVRFLGSSGKT